MEIGGVFEWPGWNGVAALMAAAALAISVVALVQSARARTRGERKEAVRIVLIPESSYEGLHWFRVRNIGDQTVGSLRLDAQHLSEWAHHGANYFGSIGPGQTRDHFAIDLLPRQDLPKTVLFTWSRPFVGQQYVDVPSTDDLAAKQ